MRADQPNRLLLSISSDADPEPTLEPRELLRYEAVRLFVKRAAAAAPGFAVDEENAVDIARICLRLDGLPLALELADVLARLVEKSLVAAE